MSIENLPSEPKALRHLIRRGEWTGVTSGLANGYVQANLVILPQAQAFDFLLFCQRNARSCPLIEVIELGATEPVITSPGGDIRTDLPLYRIFRDGILVDEVRDVSREWREDLVTFLIGCSFTFESALISAGIPLRHIEEGKNVAMYTTNIPTLHAGQFSGPIVVSMRPVARQKVVKAVQVTSRFPNAHGAPLHIGDPLMIGIQDLGNPDFGDPVHIGEEEVPLFWACGVTPQAVAMQSKPPFMITHAPGHMFITDLRDDDLAVL